MDRLDWLDTATKKIRFRPDRKAVRRELEAHLEDLREASGLEEDAVLQAMGDPVEIAEELGRVHRPWLGYLWRLSQLALVGAVLVCCLMLGLLAARGSLWRLPGQRLSEYRNWAGSTGTISQTVLEERELSSDAAVRTGGYTIRVDKVTLRKENNGDRPPQWNLYINLDITMSRWEEPVYLWGSLADWRTDAGPLAGRVHDGYACWGFWQKYLMVFEDFPEDAEWVEVDIGHGDLRRTLHIGLTEEAET